MFRRETWHNGGSNSNGNYWFRETGEHAWDCDPRDHECTCDIEAISAFEDVQAGPGLPGQWLAWNGADDISTHTGLYLTRDEAVAALTGAPPIMRTAPGRWVAVEDADRYSAPTMRLLTEEEDHEDVARELFVRAGHADDVTACAALIVIAENGQITAYETFEVEGVMHSEPV